jgi:DNA helicase II / ATP-dependent DNA helicase PcrA
MKLVLKSAKRIKPLDPRMEAEAHASFSRVFEDSGTGGLEGELQTPTVEELRSTALKPCAERGAVKMNGARTDCSMRAPFILSAPSVSLWLCLVAAARLRWALVFLWLVGMCKTRGQGTTTPRHNLPARHGSRFAILLGLLRMDLLANLNPQQRVAVQHGRGPALVLAGAGSGKTRVITYRIVYLIRNAASRPENILAVTFTNKAAGEMRQRVQALMGPSRTSEPLISTFHSFCVRMLRREIHRLGYRSDFSIYDTDDQRRLMKQILKDAGKDEKEFSPREVLARISFAKNHDIGPEQYAARFPSPIAEDIGELFERYNGRLRQGNALDFDDILLKMVVLLDKYPDQRNYYSDWFRYILVDEYQDTNRPQYELLQLLTAKHQNLFVVGDEDQSIYKFRGADIQNILRFEKDFVGARIIKLEQNYRSTQNILRLATSVVEHNTERKGKVLWTENHSGDVITCRRSASARSEAAWVCRQIRAILDEEPDFRIAVLYRANFLSRNFEEALLGESIPYAVVGSVAFFGRKEIKDLLAYLRIICNPEDDIALLRIINTPPRGIGSTTIDLLTQSALEKRAPLLQVVQEAAQDPRLGGRACKALQKFLELLAGWQARRDTVSMAELLKSIAADIEYKKMLEKDETAEEAASRMENIEELIRAAEESEERGETVFEFLDRASLSSELDALDPNARVSLMTLHSAKGLEFDVVFLAGLEEGLFPHSQSMNSPADLEEERRLCYVGITRARRKLFLVWTPFRRNFGPDAGSPSLPSRFLEEMPAELVEGLGTAQDYGTGDEEEENDDSFTVDEEDDRKPGWTKSRAADESSLPQPKSIAELRAYLQQTRQSAKPGRTAAASGSGLKSGMRVRHAQFGEGIILSRQRVGNDVKLIVTFGRVGRKTLIERYAKLEAI